MLNLKYSIWISKQKTKELYNHVFEMSGQSSCDDWPMQQRIDTIQET